MVPPTLLAVCTVAPWPITNGYSLRVYHILKQLSATWQIKLIAPSSEKDSDNFPAEIAEHIPINLRGQGLSYPWRFDQESLRTAVHCAVLKYSPDRALVWRGAEAVWIDTPGLPPGVFDIIDCTPLDLWRGLLIKQSPRLRVRKIKELGISTWFARRAIKRFSTVICAGEADAYWLRRIGGQSSVTVVSNGVALPQLAKDIDETDSIPDRPRLSFVGTLDFEPNVDAIQFLISQIWPLVRIAYPEAELLIVGRNPKPSISVLNGSFGVVVKANVSDVFSILRQSQVSIAPMRSGVGVKNKVLEAWACGVPVVLTPLAINGLVVPPGHERLIHLTARNLAQAVIEMFQGSGEARRLGARARQHVSEHYTWSISADKINRLLRDAAPDHLHQRSPTSQPEVLPERVAPQA